MKGLMQPYHWELPTLMMLLWGFRTTQCKDSLKMQEEGLFSATPTATSKQRQMEKEA
jgi:hypothetical protein